MTSACRCFSEFRCKGIYKKRPVEITGQKSNENQIEIKWNQIEAVKKSNGIKCD